MYDGVSEMKIGILAVQGDFDAHRAMLERLGAGTVLVKSPSALEGLDGLVLPGGESTTHLKFLLEEGLFEPIRALGLRGEAILATCAGAILLAREVKNPAQPSLGLLDVVIERNAYGRQLASEVTAGPSALRPEPLEMVYIRAPVIDEVGPGVEVLARREGSPVLVRQGSILAATFHPELTSDTAVHELFLKLASGGTGFQAARRSPATRDEGGPGGTGAKPRRVLFVCVGNSCRSQIAEALARALASDVIDPSSAGLSPFGEIAEPTRRVLLERGVPFDGQYSKGLTETDWRNAEVIVNMTGIPVRSIFGEERLVLDWEIRDPFGEDLGIYREVAEEIEENLRELAEALRATLDPPVDRAAPARTEKKKKAASRRPSSGRK
jgi:pyridoxal 5'-phosphate synthase pdxT subunit